MPNTKISNVKTQDTLSDITEKPIKTNKIEIIETMDFNVNVLSKKIAASEDVVINHVIAKLISERLDWEENEYHSSNERLYSILTACFELFETLKWDSVALNSFYRYLNTNGLVFKSSTHLMVKIISVVFGSDSHRTKKYASKLRILHEQKISANEIKNYLYKCGGIDEVKRKPKEDVMPKFIKGKAALYGNYLATIKSDALFKDFKDTNYVDKEGILLLANYNRENDEFNILRVVQNQAALNAAYAYLSSNVGGEEINQLKKVLENQKVTESENIDKLDYLNQDNSDKSSQFKFYKDDAIKAIQNDDHITNLNKG